MPDKKQSCKNFKTRHLPPTGKKCQFKNSVKNDKSVSNGLRDAAASSKLLDTDQADPRADSGYRWRFCPS